MTPRTIGHVTVLEGADHGRYPDGNAILIRGASETALVDPTLSIAAAASPPAGVDRILISHCHEDHLAGVSRYPDVPIHVHEEDWPGLQSLDGLMAIYGMPAAMEPRWREEVVQRFHYVPRPDARTFADGDVFDLGEVSVHGIHLPGHTRGHSGFFVEPDGTMLLSDVDLSGFGPYYGDAWSSLDDFERTLQRCRTIVAHAYVTFHHKGIVEDRGTLLRLIDEYEAVIGRRERALLDYLDRPRTLDEIVAHRFIYRPHVQLLFVEAVERRSAELHLARLLARGAVQQVLPGTFLACRNR
jgi:glyoxylase-like metal-dependent hydrolase (beta-lactamase superfamily II)